MGSLGFANTYCIAKDVHKLVKPLLFPESVTCIFISGDILQRL